MEQEVSGSAPKREDDDSSCSSPGCECQPAALDRRQFIQLLGRASTMAAGAATLIAPQLAPQKAVAGPFEASDFERLIPAEKKLSPEWIRSLYTRGEGTVYRGSDLETIGMPVGGVCAGLLYLGGDGKLWLWDIMNQEHVGILGAGTSGENYVHPVKPVSPVRQGFSLQIQTAGKSVIRPLDYRGWKNLSFQGQYPIGQVQYSDPDTPVSVRLEAYSPFIPLNTDDSSLPATVMSYTITNESDAAIEVTLAGWMRNDVAMYTSTPVVRTNSIARESAFTFLQCGMEPAQGATPQYDHGSMGIGVFRKREEVTIAAMKGRELDPDSIFAENPGTAEQTEATNSSPEELIGALKCPLTIPPKVAQTVTFVVTWHFKHVQLKEIEGAKSGRHYATRFADAQAVARYVNEHFDRLQSDTRLWRDTWYGGTLPHWFLERTLANVSILATTTCYRFATGRFYGWEGVGCCAGTCTHVWSYAQAAARLFPELERTTREMVDYGISFETQTGQIDYRGEAARKEATDGQAGTILRTYREHQMCPDDGFLTKVWPRTKKAIGFLIRKDPKQEGILRGAQPNTLDADWYGEISWISSMYVAALLAGEQMALEMKDEVFAAQCRRIADRGGKYIADHLFNGEYFVQKADPAMPDVIGSYGTCEIDQVLGQSWVWQVGLGRVLDRTKTLSALGSLWKYNFTPDVGPFRKAFPAGRWYALPGEGGLIMATNPNDIPNPYRAASFWSVEYFDECMTGFEHQVASHMIAEGMVEQGLAVTRAIHERYHASRRNPFNEIECSDHYSRAMASYGSFLTMCGFEYHGPKQHIGFAPRLSDPHFEASFVAAQGWGTFRQDARPSRLEASLAVKWGQVPVRTIALQLPAGHTGTALSASLNNDQLRARSERSDQRLTIVFESPVTVKRDDVLKLTI